MAGEIDKTTEARRKALRNGEEDPVIVAQRFLNIYRQRHIFSPERKEAFDKMLLELSPDIRGLFSSLPGGLMLQDYVDELAEKNGVEKAVRQNISIEGLDQETHQQAQILAAALAQAQPQQPAAASPAGGKISMDKDFAGELARVMGSVLQQQTTMQAQSLEKLALDLSKTQMFIAKTMKDDKEERQNELNDLCKSLAQGIQPSSENNSNKDFETFYQKMVEAQQADREEHRKEIAEFCRTIAQSQTALISSLKGLSNIEAGTVSNPIGVTNSDESTTKKLIEVVLDGQKQLNSRLDKVEAFSEARANDNQQMIAAFERSQAEMIKNLTSTKSETVQIQGDSEERLLQVLNDNQEKLIKTLLSANLQQNNVAQSTNNANNIQITAPDNSAQMLLLVDKIASLQVSNEQNLEKAITRAIEEQGRLYDKISRQQTKELAEIIAESLKEASRPVVYTVAPTAAIQEAQTMAPNLVPEQMSEKVSEVLSPIKEEAGHIPPKLEDFDEDMMPSNEAEHISDEISDISEENEAVSSKNLSSIEENVLEISEEETEPKKKKRKRKKKKKQNTQESQDEIISQNEELIDNVEDIQQGNVLEDFDLSSDVDNIQLPETQFQTDEMKDALDDDFVVVTDIPEEIISTDENIESDQKDVVETFKDISFDDDLDIPVLPSVDESSDWGFGPSETEIAPEQSDNDNQEGEDWEWEYVEDTGDDNYQYVEAIGGNSYIYSSDLYSQERIDNQYSVIASGWTENWVPNPIIKGLVEEDDDVDPYQNSILKD